MGKILYSFPVQLLLNNLKRNHFLLLYWLFLFLVVTNNFGNILGIPYLFLDPEYLHRVDLFSFLIMGLVLAAFVMAFNITGYIIDSHRFHFLGALSRPFTKYCINNSIIPLLFLGVYLYNIIKFQILHEYNSLLDIVIMLAGMCAGMLLMFLFLFSYFRVTNKDLFKMIADKVNMKLKKIRASRLNILYRRFDRRTYIRIDNYLDWNLKFRRISDEQKFYAKNEQEAILRVFDQNHLNSVFIEILMVAIILVLGVFKENPIFEIPAAASVLLLFTMLIILTGALTYWFRGWSITVFILLMIGVNFIVGTQWLNRKSEAYGLVYKDPKPEYSLKALQHMSNPVKVSQDKAGTIHTLNRWKSKFQISKPKLVVVCASGGGQRASLWTMRSLQVADSVTGGALMNHAVLITGASGGLVGASYFRELQLRRLKDASFNIYSKRFLDNISSDNLNSTIFNFLVGDLFATQETFEYNGVHYNRDRGTAFEAQLNRNTEYFLDKKLVDYYPPVNNGKIPILLIAPTIINDGRKLFISSQPVSYMSRNTHALGFKSKKIRGVDFNSMFQAQCSDSLRFLSALRMGATFPYITPTISLPADPEIQIMDSGISDNFGIADAIHFLFVFRNWISANTSGIIILQIRDSPRDRYIDKIGESTLMQRLFIPISSIYNNWWNIQDLNNDNKMEIANAWFNGRIYRIGLEYNLASPMIEAKQQITGGKKGARFERASLNWRLTSWEKKSIRENIYTQSNQKALRDLKKLLHP